MPTPTTTSAVSTIGLSGQRNIDALLGETRWANANISYSFPGDAALWSTDPLGGYGASSGAGEPWRGAYGPLSGATDGNDQSRFASALQAWADVANLMFTKVADTPTSVGDIRAAYTGPGDMAEDTVAWAYLPTNAPAAGDIWFSAQNVAATEAWAPGSFAYLSVMHEIGHALGLKHPFEGSGATSATVAQAFDSQTYTIMSYSAKPGDTSSHFSFSPTTPMTLDIAAMQYVYGANQDFHSADTSYTFDDTTTYHETLWDAGGTDTIRYQGDQEAIIDLQAGAGSSIGKPVYVVSAYGQNLYAVNNLWIAYGSTIEHASGGRADDVITGNDANNGLMGGAGNDRLDGGAGIDTALYAGQRASFEISKTASGFTLHTAQGEGTDQLSNMERLQFADKALALDLGPSGHAGQALAFIGLLAPDLIGAPSAVGTMLRLFDQGLSMREVCQMGLDVGLVASIAGDSTNAALAATLYRHVMGSVADAATVDHLVGFMDGRFAQYSQAGFMAEVATMDVNYMHIGLVGLQQTGIEFI